jgi:hypothetical protein
VDDLRSGVRSRSNDNHITALKEEFPDRPEVRNQAIRSELRDEIRAIGKGDSSSQRHIHEVHIREDVDSCSLMRDRHATNATRDRERELKDLQEVRSGRRRREQR